MRTWRSRTMSKPHQLSASQLAALDYVVHNDGSSVLLNERTAVALERRGCLEWRYSSRGVYRWHITQQGLAEHARLMEARRTRAGGQR